MTERTPQDQDKYVVRFPDGLRDRLKEEASVNNRSLNAEIISRIETSFDNLEVQELNARIDQLNDSHYAERARLYELINSQDRTLQQLQLTTRNFTIVAKALGKAFLGDGEDRETVLTVLARILLELEEDDSSDASEPVPKKPWED